MFTVRERGRARLLVNYTPQGTCPLAVSKHNKRSSPTALNLPTAACFFSPPNTSCIKCTAAAGFSLLAHSFTLLKGRHRCFRFVLHPVRAFLRNTSRTEGLSATLTEGCHTHALPRPPPSPSIFGSGVQCFHLRILCQHLRRVAAVPPGEPQTVSNPEVRMRVRMRVSNEMDR